MSLKKVGISRGQEAVSLEAAAGVVAEVCSDLMLVVRDVRHSRVSCHRSGEALAFSALPCKCTASSHLT